MDLRTFIEIHGIMQIGQYITILSFTRFGYISQTQVLQCFRELCYNVQVQMLHMRV